jgi:hypothetical protein
MSGFTIAFLLVDASMKLLALPIVLQAGAALGFAGALLTHVLFGVYVGAVLWCGLYLRDARLRQLVPRRPALLD